MGYIKFDKNQLINLEYSLDKEMVRSNRAGSFSCTTILGCNTRKYHGLLFTPQPDLDGELHLLLSKVDETIIQRDAAFNIGVNRFPGTFSPKGHKYVRDFSADVIPVVTYRVGGVILTKETMFISRQERVLIKYTLVEAHSPTKLKLKPFLAFRNMHRLSKKNIDLDTRYQPVQNGIKVKMYHGYADLYLQLSKNGGEYVHVPDWYNDFEYPLEKERGYEYHEDLYNPGFFEIDIKKGESIIFSASTAEARSASLSRMFNQEIQKRTPRNSFENCLVNSAEQFFYGHSGKSGIIAGYPWYSQITRYSFIALPGLSQATEDHGICEQIFDSLIADMQGSSFVEMHTGQHVSYESADTALWFFYALQNSLTGKKETGIWKKYGHVMAAILNGYARGEINGIRLHDNGLLHIDEQYPALTWMNARVHKQAVTPRYGYVVEVNALWYNAIAYAINLAQKSRDKEFMDTWKPLARKIRQSFTPTFWLSGQQYLADYVYEDKQEASVRPNQLFAISLPYPVLEESKRKYVLDVIIKELLTPRGLRSLSPKDPKYIGRYEGDESKRDNALHQGTVWPWLLGHFSDAYLNLYGNDNLTFIQNIYNGFETIIKENGIGSVSELYNGDPPHLACGAPSFAPSVAELIRIFYRLNPEKRMAEDRNKKNTKK